MFYTWQLCLSNICVMSVVFLKLATAYMPLDRLMHKKEEYHFVFLLERAESVFQF